MYRRSFLRYLAAAAASGITPRVAMADYGMEALAYGFATSLHADPLAAARSTAREIAARNPNAVRAIKRLLNAACDSDAAAILLAESKEQGALIGSPNQIEAVRAGMEGRAGRFTD